MAGLPLLKLSSLLIKTISKPLSTRLKFEASRFPKFYKASVSIGQTSHYLQSRINVLASGYKFLGVKPLPADEAMEVGVSYLADGIVIALGATIIIVEYNRGEAKNKIKAEKAAIAEECTEAALEARFASIERKISDIEEALPLKIQAKIYATRADRLAALEIAAAEAAALAASEATAAAEALAEQERVDSGGKSEGKKGGKDEIPEKKTVAIEAKG